MDLVLNFVVPVANVSQWGIIAEYYGFFFLRSNSIILAEPRNSRNDFSCSKRQNSVPNRFFYCAINISKTQSEITFLSSKLLRGSDVIWSMYTYTPIHAAKYIFIAYTLWKECYVSTNAFVADWFQNRNIFWIISCALSTMRGRQRSIMSRSQTILQKGEDLAQIPLIP